MKKSQRVGIVFGMFLFGLAIAVRSGAEEPARIAGRCAPGSETRRNEPEKREGSNVSNVHDPSLTTFLPAADTSTGTAVIIAPGGGHRVLCLGH